jgi:hypothetical protein
MRPRRRGLNCDKLKVPFALDAGQFRNDISSAHVEQSSLGSEETSLSSEETSEETSLNSEESAPGGAEPRGWAATDRARARMAPGIVSGPGSGVTPVTWWCGRATA